ncbi:hypothetical protein SO802_006363 [Lithocarpus litseifolius]|uniref:Uncharacterized protein n=1 Tax=Lithocarpus litseifolius TaxID=425828 RepID=A0AAW2DPM0_9ROSI
MISVIAHELVELSSNPLVNAWYAGEDPTAPTEIGNLCEGLYGNGGGGGYIGQVMKGRDGMSFNMNGIRNRSMATANAGQIDHAHPGPINDSVLTLQPNHRSEAIWNGQDPGSLTCRARSEEFSNREPMVDD